MKNPTQLRIVCAATKFYLLDETELIVASPRHFDQIARGALSRVGPHTELEQGFVDQFGTFHTREVAWRIARAAGQIIRRCGGDTNCLYSENLY